MVAKKTSALLCICTLCLISLSNKMNMVTVFANTHLPALICMQNLDILWQKDNSTILAQDPGHITLYVVSS